MEMSSQHLKEDQNGGEKSYWTTHKDNITRILLVIISVLLLGTCMFLIGHFTARTVNVTQGNAGMAGAAGLAGSVDTLECQEPDSLRRSFPDLDYALKGYHILRGYPLETGHDPGFSLPVFSADYSRGGHSADCRYHVPHGLAITPDVSCITSFTSQIIQTRYELSRSLSTSASVSGGGWGVKFSASFGYQTASSTVSSGKYSYVVSACRCRYYYSELIPQAPPPFHPAFIKFLHDLNSQPDNAELFYAFFDAYGTHVSTSMIFGASYVNQNKMTTTSLESMASQGINVATAASYSGLFSIGAEFSLSDEQKQLASDFREVVEIREITTGSLPPSEGGAAAWASTVQDNPVPVSHKLISIEEIFTESYMGVLGIDYNRLRAKINERKYNYCEHLKEKGEVDSCSELTPGLELPNTRLVNHYRSVRANTAVCINTCMNDVMCTGISWDAESEQNWCFFFKETGPVRSTSTENWQSIIFLTKIYQTWTMNNTEIEGVSRSDGQRIDSIGICHDMCKADRVCVAYSYCDCATQNNNCKLFSETGIEGMKEQSGTNSIFVTRMPPTPSP